MKKEVLQALLKTIQENPGDPVILNDSILQIADGFDKMNTTVQNTLSKNEELTNKYNKAVEINGDLMTRVGFNVEEKEDTGEDAVPEINLDDFA